jgi:glycosyltransferase involved in cell wall biosynthesis
MMSRGRPQLFHATDFNGLVRVRGVATVTTLYDLTALKEGFRSRGLSARLSDLRWWVYYQHKLPRADHIIAISDSAKQDAVSLLGIPPERITTIPLGVDLKRFTPQRNEGRFASEAPYLLFVGGRAANKNLDRVLDAFAEVGAHSSDLHLYLAGPWRPEDAEWLMGKCSNPGVRRRIRHLGFVHEEDLPSLYSNALAFLFPSLQEGFGLPVLEAMACGTSVITSNRGALLEVAGDAGLLVDPTDTLGLTSAIERVAEDKVLRLDLQERGVVRARAFNWEAVAKRTLEVYERVLGAA